MLHLTGANIPISLEPLTFNGRDTKPTCVEELWPPVRKNNLDEFTYLIKVAHPYGRS